MNYSQSFVEVPSFAEGNLNTGLFLPILDIESWSIQCFKKAISWRGRMTSRVSRNLEITAFRTSIDSAMG